MIRVADYIMQRIADLGTKELFLVTGRGMLYLSDAAAKSEKLHCVSVHHEQAGAFAAMAYAQASGLPGACMVSTGCAGTNALTGVLCAWQDEVPCVFISGQNTLAETVRHTHISVRTFGQQEADIVKIVSSITKYAVMIENPEDIAFELDKAFYLMLEGRKGPVWIDVPLDIQNMRIEEEKLQRFNPPVTNQNIDKQVLEVIIEKLKNAKRPVLLLGSAVGEVGGKVFKLVEKLHIPTVYENSAVDIYPYSQKYACGCVGAMGANRSANMTIQNSDFVLAVGCKLSTMTVGNDKSKFAREAQIAVIDVDDAETKKNTVNIDFVVIGNLSEILDRILEQADFSVNSKWVEKCLHWKNIFPLCEEERKHSEKVDLYFLAENLSKLLPEDAILVCDAGLEELLMPTTIVFQRGQKCVQPAMQGCMGFALPASYGAYLANKRPVVAVIGDGSVMMNLQELQTIAYHQFPLKIIIVNNNCYAVIRKRQKDLFRTRTIGNDSSDGLSCPDFSKVADCFGLDYIHISGTKDLFIGLEKLMQTAQPVICEVGAIEDQTYLHSSYARTKSGKFVQRPLEDQSPYLPRDLFLSEMVINPIDQ